MKSLRIATLAAALVAAAAATPAWAETTVAEAWVRATVAQQKATGLFAKITSTEGAKLVGASSPVAGVVEVHEMKMEGDVMRMRAVEGGLALPAGQMVELKPGGYHVMLMDLKQAVKAGDEVHVMLKIQKADGQTEDIMVMAPAKAMGGMGMKHQHMQQQGHQMHKH
jgi:hypothetical protein